MAGRGYYFCCYCRRQFVYREDLISHVLSHYKDEDKQDQEEEEEVGEEYVGSNGLPGVQGKYLQVSVGVSVGGHSSRRVEDDVLYADAGTSPVLHDSSDSVVDNYTGSVPGFHESRASMLPITITRVPSSRPLASSHSVSSQVTITPHPHPPSLQSQPASHNHHQAQTQAQTQGLVHMVQHNTLLPNPASAANHHTHNLQQQLIHQQEHQQHSVAVQNSNHTHQLNNGHLHHQQVATQQQQLGHSKEVLTAADQKYRCETCGKYFKYSHHFKAHKRIHEGEGHFSCDHCGKVFSQTAHLIRHKRIHTGERPFSCDLCLKTFNQSSHLIRHKRVHTGERPFVCDHCHKSFSQSAHLMKHRRVHSGERPFPCEGCNKTFTQQVNLTKHRRSHHPENGVVLMAPETPVMHQNSAHVHPEDVRSLLDPDSSLNHLSMGMDEDDDVEDDVLDDDYGSPICEDFKAACSPPIALSVGVGTG